MFILKGYKIGFSIRFYYGLVRRYWVSHMGLTKTMPKLVFNLSKGRQRTQKGSIVLCYSCVQFAICHGFFCGNIAKFKPR